MLLGSTEQSDVPDIQQQQQQAGPLAPSLSENCVTSTLLSDKENCAELVTNLDPVNPEIMRSPVAQKSADKSQVKVLIQLTVLHFQNCWFIQLVQSKIQRLRNM